MRTRSSLLVALMAVSALPIHVDAATCGNWQQVATGHRLHSVASGSGGFAAVGVSGVTASSPDGEEWTYHPQIEGRPTLSQVIWTGSQYLAVGDEGTIVASHDGMSWSEIPAPSAADNYNLESIAWSGSLYALSGQRRDGRRGALWTSPDLETWTVRYDSSVGYPHFVLWDGQQFLWAGDSGYVATSPDGAVWDLQFLGLDVALRRMVWNGSQYLLTAANGSVAWTSTDASIWEFHEGLSMPAVDVEWVGSRYVGVSGNRVWSSQEGLSWTVENETWKPLLAVAWDGRQVILVGDFEIWRSQCTEPEAAFSFERSRPLVGDPVQFFDTSKVSPTSWAWDFGDGTASNAQNPNHAYSTQGTFNVSLTASSAAGASMATQSITVSLPVESCGTWSEVATGNRLRSVTHGGSGFVAVGVSGVTASSPDGEEWTYHSQIEGRPLLNHVIWTGSQYVAVGDEGAIVASPDGVTWTTLPRPLLANSYHLESIAWNGSQFVVVGRRPTSGRGGLWTSPDGVTWTLRFANSGLVPRHVMWDGGQFIWVGDNGLLATSASGAVWEVQALGTSLSLRKVVWNGSQYLLTASNGSAAWTSTDASTWEVHEGLSQDVEWVGDRYVGVLGNQVWSSQDGLSWTVEGEAAQPLLSVGWDGRQIVTVGTTTLRQRCLPAANADLWVASGANREFAVLGGQIEYIFRISNRGPDAAQTVEFSLSDFPDGLEVRKIEGCTGWDGESKACRVEALGSGEHQEVTLGAVLTQLTSPGTSARFFGRAFSRQTPDPNSDNNTASLSTRLHRRPLLVIPGLLGTEMYQVSEDEDEQDHVIWPVPFPDWEKLSLDSNGQGASNIYIKDILRDYVFSAADTYGPLISGLRLAGWQEERSIFTFPYDWRQSNVTSAEDLADLVEKVRSMTGAGDLDFVGHSMGGLVIRLFLARHGDHLANHVIYLGSPHAGSVDSFLALSEVDRVNKHVQVVPEWGNVNEQVKAAKTFPSVYQLLPSSPFFEHDTLSLELAETYVANLDGQPFMDVRHLDAFDEIQTVFDASSAQFRQTSILGSGLPTLGRLSYGTRHLTALGNIYEQQSEEPCWLAWSEDGDGTVTSDSGRAAPNSRKVIYVDGIEHTMLPKTGSVAELVSKLLRGEEVAPMEGADFDWLSWSACSPVRVTVMDDEGNLNGVTDDNELLEQIPRSSFFELPHGQGGFLQATKNHMLRIDAYEAGLFGLHVHRQDGKDSEEITGFEGIPVTPESKAVVSLTANSLPSQLELDVDGDGVSDFTVEAGDQPPPLASLSVLVDVVSSLNIRSGIKTSLLAKLDAASSAEARGQAHVRRGQVAAFRNAVRAQWGKALSEEDFVLLMQLSEALVE